MNDDLVSALKSIDPMQQATDEINMLRGVLLELDRQGGLGDAKHEMIAAALHVPYPRFCMHTEKCMGQSSCQRDPCCAD